MVGRNNDQLEQSIQRLHRGGTYRDQSTVIVVPTRGMIHSTVVNSWIQLMRPMNQMVGGPVFFQGYEVADAYNQAVEWVLAYNAQMVANKQRSFRYMLTLEEDNCPPPDGLLKLLESIEAGPFEAVGGLYWTKGEGGQPMVYGDPRVLPRNFAPQVPVGGAVQRCNGLGMGFTLFRVELFVKMAADVPRGRGGAREWFKTVQRWSADGGGAAFTQDLYFFDQAAKYGATFASDNRVHVGHHDAATDYTW